VLWIAAPAPSPMTECVQQGPGWVTSGSLSFAFALRWEVLVAVPGVETAWALERMRDGGDDDGASE
jgi:hypothetical protein